MTKRSYTKNRKPDPRKGIPIGEKSPRRAIARELKASGMTYAQIGERMGITRQRAQQLVAPTPLMQKKLVARANGKCERCGKGGKLHGHHSTYAGNPDEFLCTSCHLSEHGRNRKQMAETKVTRNITLDPETDALVVTKRDELAAITGDENYSAAIRVIVREWKASQTAPAPDAANVGA